MSLEVLNTFRSELWAKYHPAFLLAKLPEFSCRLFQRPCWSQIPRLAGYIQSWTTHKEATHHSGHTLDLVITRSDDHDLISHVSVTDPAISDHYAVLCMISITKPCYPRREINCRKLKSIDMERFVKGISNSSLTDATYAENVTDLTSLYDGTLLSILDQHASLNPLNPNTRI